MNTPSIQDQLPARSGMKGEHVMNREVFLAELEETALADRRRAAALRRLEGER